MVFGVALAAFAHGSPSPAHGGRDAKPSPSSGLSVAESAVASSPAWPRVFLNVGAGHPLVFPLEVRRELRITCGRRLGRRVESRCRWRRLGLV